MTGDLRFGGWFDGHAAKQAAQDKGRRSERIGQLAGMVIALIVAAYFTILYTSGSGFFTSMFTTADAILFFGIAFLGVIPGLLKAIIGTKNSTRPLDVILSVSILIAAVLFLNGFPFDFSHFADALPASLQFLVSWIGDGLAKAIMFIAIVANIFIIPYTTLLYLAVRQKLLRPTGDGGTGQS